MTLGQIISAVGGSAALFGAMAWLARSIVTHVLSKDIEKYKVNLHAESQRELVRLQSALQLVEFEHQVRFSRLYERKVTILGEIYSRLVGLHRTASVFVGTYHGVDEQKKRDYLQQLWDAADRHNEYFERHRIFLQDELCQRIDSFRQRLSRACSKLAFLFQAGDAVGVSYDEIWEAWNDASKMMESEIPNIQKLLIRDFREELGVLQGRQKADA